MPAKDNPIEPINRIAVDAETAAALLSISRSLFDRLVGEGSLPKPGGRAGVKPLWLVAGLVQAMGGILSNGGQPPPCPTAAQAEPGEDDKDKWAPD